jgi:O-antigen/teichoic acid export membrane protein
MGCSSEYIKYRLNKNYLKRIRITIDMPMLRKFFNFLSYHFNDIKNRFIQSHLAKGLVIIGSGIFIAQLITIIATPIITRIYSPADYGILVVFTSTLAIIVIAGGFRYDSALPLPNEDIDAANLLILFFILLLSTSILLLIILFYFGDLFFSVFNATEIHPYFFLFLIGFFFAGLYRSLTYWVTRRRDYIRITHTKINQSIAGAGSKILFGVLSFGPLGLVIGEILSETIGTTTLLRKMWQLDRKLFKNISLTRIKVVAKEYRQFPLFSFPAAIFNTLATSAPTIMLASIYGFEVAGYYGLAFTLLVLPGSLISQSMAQVYYAEASHMIREKSGDLLSLFESTTKKLLIIGIPLIGIPSLIAPFFFPLIFGSVWKEAGYYCLPLALTVIGGFVMASTTNLGGYGYNHWMLAFDISRAILVILIFYISMIYAFPVLFSLFCYSILMSIMYCILFILNIAAIRRVKNPVL